MVDGRSDQIGPVLFTDSFKPIYNPLLFASTQYQPTFWPTGLDMNASRVFTMEQVDRGGRRGRDWNTGDEHVPGDPPVRI